MRPPSPAATLSTTERTISFAGVSEQVTGTQASEFAAAHARLSQLIGNDSVYLRPSVDGGAMYHRTEAFDETGSTLVGMSIEEADRFYYAVSPSLELGAEFGTADTTLVRPYIRAGVTQFFGDVSPVVLATLEQAPAGIAPFETVDDFDRTFINVDGGLTALSRSGAVLKLSGSWSRSENFEQFGGSMKFSVPLQRPSH